MIKDILLKIVGPISYSDYFSSLIDLFEKCLWPLTIIVIAVLFKKYISNLIDRIISFEYRDKKLNFAAPAGKVLDNGLTAIASPNKALECLISFLSRYRYFWSAWITHREFSHAVRFSDTFYAGGKTRYIDEYVSDLEAFVKNYSDTDTLPSDIKAPLDSLKTYLNEVLPYHVEREKLSAPAFSATKYLDLFNSVLNALKNHI